MTNRLLMSAAILLIANVAAASTTAITTNADSGPGSLRQAILDANSGACASPCSISYGSTGFLTVAPLTRLPDITASNVGLGPTLPYQAWTLQISGSNLTSGSGLHIRGANCAVAGVIINGFPGSGIVLEDAINARIGSNVIGLDASGKIPLPNQQNGITIVRGRQISIDSNTIGGNAGNGVYAVGASDLFFGLDVIGKQYLPQGSGNLALGNGASGIFLMDVQRAQLLGCVIANNGLDAVATVGTSSAIRIEDLQLPTTIYNNGLMPIDIGFDGVTDQGRPVLTTADISNGFLRVVGHVSTAANASVIINIFASDSIGKFGIAHAKTSVYAAKVKTDANGFATFEFHSSLTSNVRPPIDAVGQWISATATTDATSELSAPLQAVANDQNYTVTNTNDSGAGSLRQAILDANGGICAADFPCRVQFDLPSNSGRTFFPLTPLPAITRSGITIDGANTPPSLFAITAPTIEINGSRSMPGPGLTISSANGPLVGNVIRRLAINGFNGPGILIDASNNYILNPVIANNFIGTDLTGAIAVPNTGDGVHVRGNVPFVHIGTFGSGNRFERNLISGNGGNGITLESGFFEFDTNAIGTDITRKLPVPNSGAGVKIEAAAQGHLEANTIAFNSDVGLSTVTTSADAFKAAIQNSIHSNVGPAIRQREVVQLPPQITSVTYDPSTKTGTITGTFTPAGLQYFTTTLDFFFSTYPEADGRGSGETPLYNISSSILGQQGGSFTTKTNAIDLRGKRISATATPFEYEGFKGPPQGEVFGQGFKYGTTSEMSRAVPVVTTGCSADQPQIAGSIASGTMVTLNWSAVAGATGYNVWLRSVPGAPRVIARTAATTAVAAIPPGHYEWFVEATFTACPPIKSEAASLEVISGRQRAVRR
jgi:hypothetical protein